MDWKRILNTRRLKPSSRIVDENGYDLRNEFESDFGRVVFSPAIRRMHDKTQVFPLTIDDNIHTRLTHSLEVQSVAYSIGMNICVNKKMQNRFLGIDDPSRCIPTILSAIALCHDIGNPPFGHSGEKNICCYFDDYFKKNNNIELTENEKKDFLKFDGNAQGFRILTKLQVLQDQYGLNLTLGTLSAFLKYPFTSDEIDMNKPFRKKVGVFQSEKEYLKIIREQTGLMHMRNPLTFLMEAADDICYNVMDMEDGCNYGYYDYNKIIDFLKDKGDIYVNGLINDFEKQENEITAKGVNIAITNIVKLRVFLIQKLVDSACEEFINNFDNIQNGIYYNDLTGSNNLNEILHEFAKENIYKKREIQRLELTGEKILKVLLEHFVDSFVSYNSKESSHKERAEKLFNIISRSLKELLKIEIGYTELYKISVYYKLRLIVDYISGMTDKFALDLFQRLQGIKI